MERFVGTLTARLSQHIQRKNKDLAESSLFSAQSARQSDEAWEKNGKDAMMGLIGLMGLKGPVTTHYNIITTLLQHCCNIVVSCCLMLYHVVSCCALLVSSSSRPWLHNAFQLHNASLMLLGQSTNTAVCCGNMRHGHGERSDTGARTIGRKDLHNEGN